MFTTIQEYLQSQAVTSLSDSTQDLYLRSLNHFRDFLTNNEIKKEDDTIDYTITPERFSIFVKGLEKRNLSGQTIQQYINCVKIYLKWAKMPLEYTYKVSNKDRQANKLKHLNRWFQEDDIAKCLAYTFPYASSPDKALLYRVLIRLLAETGGRIGEIANIQMEDVDIEECMVVIHGKTEPRPVFFSPDTREMLKSLRQSFKAWHGALFPSVMRLQQVVTEMLNDIGLKKEGDGRGPHTFRHYVASYLFYSGMRIEDVSFLLGDTVETIVKNYLHPTSLMLKERVAKAMKWEG